MTPTVTISTIDFVTLSTVVAEIGGFAIAMAGVFFAIAYIFEYDSLTLRLIEQLYGFNAEPRLPERPLTPEELTRFDLENATNFGKSPY